MITGKAGRQGGREAGKERGREGERQGGRQHLQLPAPVEDTAICWQDSLGQLSSQNL